MASITLKVKVNSKTGRVLSVQPATKRRRTKKAIARSLFARFPNASSARMIKLFRDKAKLTLKGARTYFYSIRNESAA